MDDGRRRRLENVFSGSPLSVGRLSDGVMLQLSCYCRFFQTMQECLFDLEAELSLSPLSVAVIFVAVIFVAVIICVASF